MKKYFLLLSLFPSFFLLAQKSEKPVPSLKDKSDAEIKKIKDNFQKIPMKDDSAFIVIHSDAHLYTIENISQNQFADTNQGEFFKAKVGDVVGPFVYGNVNCIYKIISSGSRPDSVRVRHLLIAYAGAERATATRTKDQAKTLVDSLANAVVSGHTKMEDLIMNYTDDPGSKSGNFGDYGWFTFESGFVQEFKDAGFNNPKGKSLVIETAFGYHIIQVLDQSRKKQIVGLAGIFKVIDPKLETILFQDKCQTPGNFPGGFEAIGNYLKANVKYPKAEKKAHVTGVVFVHAVLGKDGTITNLTQVVGIPGHPAFTLEAIRLVLAMPKWEPCRNFGIPVENVVVIPVVFDLE